MRWDLQAAASARVAIPQGSVEQGLIDGRFANRRNMAASAFVTAALIYVMRPSNSYMKLTSPKLNGGWHYRDLL